MFTAALADIQLSATVALWALRILRTVRQTISIKRRVAA